MAITAPPAGINTTQQPGRMSGGDWFTQNAPQPTNGTNTATDQGPYAGVQTAPDGSFISLGIPNLGQAPRPDTGFYTPGSGGGIRPPATNDGLKPYWEDPAVIAWNQTHPTPFVGSGAPYTGPTTPGYQPYNTFNGQSGTATTSQGMNESGPNVGQPTGGGDWISQALSAAQSTDDPNYWRGVIAKDPKVAAGDQSAIDYWKGRIAQGDGAAAVRNGTTQPANGGSSSGAGSPTDIMNQDPGFKFRMDEGLKALQHSAAARGTLLTGGTQKALTRYGQDYASGEFQNVFNRNLSLSDLGLRAATGANASGSDYSTNATNALTGQGNANAAGQVGSANAWNNALSQEANNVAYQSWLKSLNPTGAA